MGVDKGGKRVVGWLSAPFTFCDVPCGRRLFWYLTGVVSGEWKAVWPTAACSGFLYFWRYFRLFPFLYYLLWDVDPFPTASYLFLELNNGFEWDEPDGPKVPGVEEPALCC